MQDQHRDRLFGVWAVVLVLSFALGACSGGGGGGGGGAPAATGTISGTVRDADSGAPIAGATVEVLDGATVVATTTTDADGYYTVEVDAGTGYTLRITAPGYETTTIADVDVVGGEETPVDVDAPPTPAPTGRIQGGVRDAVTRNGIAGVTVEVYDGADLIGTTMTDADGNYTLEVEAGDDLRVRFTRTGYLAADYNDLDLAAGETETLESILLIPDTFSGNGTAAGVITDSLTGNGLAGVSISLRAGLNSRTGAVVADVLSGVGGAYTVPDLPTGHYTAEMSRAGYVTGYMTVISLGGQVTDNQNGSLSPQLAAGETRVILTWGAAPADLDTHLTGPTASGPRFHVYYGSRTVNDGSVAALDLDDTSGFGPETVTITTQVAGVYRYSVHDFTNRNANPSTALSNSGAQVRVYQASGLVATFNIPPNQGGTLWTVFELDQATVTPVNTFSYVSNPGAVP